MEASVLFAESVSAAAALLAGRIHRTPCLSFQGVARGPDAKLYLKCENLQKVGAFKARGAMNHLLRRPGLKEKSRGVVTYSSGNHGAAVSWAARELGLRAHVYVPEDIAGSKAEGVRAYGGRILRAGLTSAERRKACEEGARKHGCHVVPPFDDPDIVAGQGTVALEVLEQRPDVRRVIVPVGGGGLAAGCAVALGGLAPDVELIGVEPEGAASMTAALARGSPVTIELGSTIADGLRPVRAGVLNHAILAHARVRVVLVRDEWIVQAMRLLFERARLVVEPSGAAALAAYLFHPEIDAEGETCVILSGGNVDFARLRDLLDGRP